MLASLGIQPCTGLGGIRALLEATVDFPFLWSLEYSTVLLPSTEFAGSPNSLSSF
jgi:hypothetical protein